MIDTIIFDLDGILIDSKKVHYDALNLAIKKVGIDHRISLEDHLNIFDGLPTIKKLEILNKKKVFHKKLNNKIINLKNKFTKKVLEKEIKYDPNLIKLLKKLKKKFKIGIATNAIQSTLDLSIKKLRIKKYVNFSISTKNIDNSKPHPEIYLRAMIELKSNPKNTLILEDSHFGRAAAKDSGANLMPIKNMNDVNYKNIVGFIDRNFEIKKSVNVKRVWDDPELSIVIPMAGQGSRFLKAGYSFPKPLIEVGQKPMIQVVIESLGLKGKFIFIVRKEHLIKYNLKNFLNILAPNCEVITVDKLTEGAACTVLLAKKFIDNDKPLIISNSDQYIEWNSSETMYNFISKNVDGGILTFNAIHPKWSYAKIDKNKNVIEVAEKKVISNNATVGVYYWKKGKDFVKFTNKMIKKNIRVNNEFYVCPVFNEAIKEKKKIIISNVNSMWGLGTPEDLKYFQENFKNN